MVVLSVEDVCKREEKNPLITRSEVWVAWDSLEHNAGHAHVWGLRRSKTTYVRLSDPLA